ncbi:hypothetical protein GCM10011607_06430 [Shewanella inventionis]|uniref:Uncharacterized protein n=1 Tax=Shewanella inventionis TaxID=1738770 RepID=A0ABQ1INY1_9GAMM|nr:hypothetical protein GCM10011607_06430 [Shewanella inventionis]
MTMKRFARQYSGLSAIEIAVSSVMNGYFFALAHICDDMFWVHKQKALFSTYTYLEARE